MRKLLLLMTAVVMVGCGTTTHTSSKTFTNTLGMKFVPVPGTEVQFCIWETRVQDYAAYAMANVGADGSWKTVAWVKDRDSAVVRQTDMHPVTRVSLGDAQKFCGWLTEKELTEGRIKPGQKYRLPTDAEWSMAVGLGEEPGNSPYQKSRRATIRVHPWGKEWPPPAGAGNYSQEFKADKFEWSAPVGSFAANTHGLYDLGGNVWEFCSDLLDAPRARDVYVKRGCGFRTTFGGQMSLLSVWREHTMMGTRGDESGFRCVLTNAK